MQVVDVSAKPVHDFFTGQLRQVLHLSLLVWIEDGGPFEDKLRLFATRIEVDFLILRKTGRGLFSFLPGIGTTLVQTTICPCHYYLPYLVTLHSEGQDKRFPDLLTTAVPIAVAYKTRKDKESA